MENKEVQTNVPVSEVEEAVLTPWEQHSAIISIPRFDYRAPNLLLERPFSGFLITCPIKREKSATKEAISIFEKHIVSLSTESKSLESSDDHAEKKRKINLEDTERECSFSSLVGKDALTNVQNHGRVNLSLVKLRKNGLLLFTFPCGNNQMSVDVFVKVLRSIEFGELKPPQWCHRIFPIQETCILKEINIFNVVAKLVQKSIVYNNAKKVEMPTKFAVGYDRRGLDERNKNSTKSTPKDINELDLLDRNECFKVVAKAVKHVVVESVVDLKSPELIILIELLPVSGLPNDSIVAGVSVLSHELVNTKPRLSVKPLVSEMKKKTS